MGGKPSKGTRKDKRLKENTPRQSVKSANKGARTIK